MPYGQCHYRFRKIEDKIFSRKIDDCDLKGVRNHSIIDGLTIHSYEQTIRYMYVFEQSTPIHYDKHISVLVINT